MDLKSKILHCLEKYPETRNSDIKLTNAVWYEFHNDKIKRIDDKNYVALTDLYDLPTQESIKRTRAKLNSEGKYMPTSQEVLENRRLLEKKYREEYSPSNPSRG